MCANDQAHKRAKENRKTRCQVSAWHSLESQRRESSQRDCPDQIQGARDCLDGWLVQQPFPRSGLHKENMSQRVAPHQPSSKVPAPSSRAGSPLTMNELYLELWAKSILSSPKVPLGMVLSQQHTEREGPVTRNTRGSWGRPALWRHSEPYTVLHVWNAALHVYTELLLPDVCGSHITQVTQTSHGTRSPHSFKESQIQHSKQCYRENRTKQLRKCFPFQKKKISRGYMVKCLIFKFLLCLKETESQQSDDYTDKHHREINLRSRSGTWTPHWEFAVIQMGQTL